MFAWSWNPTRAVDRWLLRANNQPCKVAWTWSPARAVDRWLALASQSTRHVRLERPSLAHAVGRWLARTNGQQCMFALTWSCLELRGAAWSYPEQKIV